MSPNLQVPGYTTFVILLCLLGGCTTGNSTENTYGASISQSARLWLPVNGLMNWEKVFPQEDVSFTANYRIESDGRISNLTVSNIIPDYQPSQSALSELATQKFVPTRENYDKTPVNVVIRIEPMAYKTPVRQ